MAKHKNNSYKSEYKKKIIDIFERGESLAHFCVEIGHPRDTVYDWIERYPDFAEAYKLAREIGCVAHIDRAKKQINKQYFNEKPFSVLGKPFENMLSNQNLKKLKKQRTVQKEIAAAEDLYISGEISLEECIRLVDKAAKKLDIKARSELELRVTELEALAQNAFRGTDSVRSPTADAVAMTDDDN